MSTPLKLVTTKDKAAEAVKEALSLLLQRATEEEFSGMAVVLIRHDGEIFVSRRSNGNRVMLLGAITDLQYTLAEDGDGE